MFPMICGTERTKDTGDTLLTILRLILDMDVPSLFAMAPDNERGHFLILALYQVVST